MSLQKQDSYRGREGVYSTESSDRTWNSSLSDDISTPRVNTCGGSAFCPRGKQDSLELGLILEERLHRMYLPGRLYIAVSGCDNQCAEVSVKDIGIIGTLDGWDVFVGDRRCRQPKSVMLLATGFSTEQVIEAVDKIVAFYRTEFKDKKRLWALIKSEGFESFKTKVLGQTKPGDCQTRPRP